MNAFIREQLGYEQLPVTDMGNDHYAVKIVLNADYGVEINCSFWKNHAAQPGQDSWLYMLDDVAPCGQDYHAKGPYSHIDKTGCLIAIYKYLVALDVIETPEDNSHLDELDAAIVTKITDEWQDRANFNPNVGDFVQYADGSIKRCCNNTGTGQQVTKAIERDYYAGRFGSISYSGGLESDIPWAQLVEQKGKRIPGRFWFFHHDKSGPGRGVEFFMPCRVFSVIEAEAGQ